VEPCGSSCCVAPSVLQRGCASMGPWRPSLRPSWAPVRLALWLVSAFFRWCFITLPRFVCHCVPQYSGLLSISFLYLFAQALGLMWLLSVNLFSIFSVRFVKEIQSVFDGESWSFAGNIQALLTGYAHYCVLRILFFIAKSFYVIGWEAFSDFPTVRLLVVKQKSSREKEIPPRSIPQRSPSPKSRGKSGRSREEEKVKEHHGSPTSAVESACDVEGLSDWIEVQHTSSGGEQTQSSPEKHEQQAAATPQPAAPRKASPSPSPLNGGPRKFADRRRRFFREATLLAPLSGLIVCTAILFTMTAMASFEVMTDISDTMASLVEPTRILNRGFRFVLFVAFLQWLQQFLYLFPKWHRGLLESRAGKIWALLGIFLLLPSLLRLFYWFLVPSGTGNTQYVIGVPHYLLDMIFILLVKIWMLVSCFFVLQQPELSGFDRRHSLIGEGDWSEMAVLFKYSLLVPLLLHFCRGCARFGLIDAQNDLLVHVCAYPLLLAAVWTLVWAVVVAPRTRLLLATAVGILVLASTVCAVAGLRQGATTAIIWLHLMRQCLKMFGDRRSKRHDRQDGRKWRGRGDLRSTSKPTQVSFTTTAPIVSSSGPAVDESKLRARGVAAERRWGGWIVIILVLVASTFGGILISLGVLSGIQQKIDWYPSSIWFEHEEWPPALRIDHLVSRLRLQERNSTGAEAPTRTMHADETLGGVSYAACNHMWHGLSVLDFSLLSLASYFDESDQSLPLLLADIFPSHTGLTWRLRNVTTPQATPTEDGIRRGHRLSWIEVEIQEPNMDKPLLVIAIRGTDPMKMSDMLEDIRMWTEPVAMSILSTVFPTVRAWPRRTAEMVINGIHDFMDALGTPDNSWSYNELVHHVSEIPRERYRQVILTGHSLGGGMAAIVSVLTHFPVVGITPPGIYWSIAKHNRNSSGGAAVAREPLQAAAQSKGGDVSSWMHHQSLTLVVENDWVNGILDDHGGLVQMMTCDRSQESLQLACHMIESTICHIFNRCGDPWRRWDTCHHEYVLTDQMQSATLKVLRGVLPDMLLDWIDKPKLPEWVGLGGNSGWLLLAFFVMLPVVGGAIEELLVL